MSKYTHAHTPVAQDSELLAMPKTGREEGIGFAGNSCFFSKAPEEDLAEGGAAGEQLYLVKYVTECLSSELALLLLFLPLRLSSTL
jgi:hypothetical protein